VTLAILSQRNWTDYLRLVRRGVASQGTITAVVPEMHGTVRYEYEVNGRAEQGQTQPHPPNPSVTSLKIGDSVRVYYDPANPTISTLGEPGALLRNETVSLLALALLLSTAMVFTLRIWFRGVSRN